MLHNRWNNRWCSLNFRLHLVKHLIFCTPVARIIIFAVRTTEHQRYKTATHTKRKMQLIFTVNQEMQAINTASQI